MTVDQVKKSFEYLGVEDVNDNDSILKKVRQFDFNNSGVLFIRPNDTTKKLIAVDYDNELLVIEELLKGRWRRHVKPFETIEGIYGLTGIKPPCVEFGIIEYEDGTEEDLANGPRLGPRTTNLDYDKFGGFITRS